MNASDSSAHCLAFPTFNFVTTTGTIVRLSSPPLLDSRPRDVIVSFVSSFFSSRFSGRYIAVNIQIRAVGQDNASLPMHDSL